MKSTEMMPYVLKLKPEDYTKVQAAFGQDGMRAREALLQIVHQAQGDDEEAFELEPEEFVPPAEEPAPPAKRRAEPEQPAAIPVAVGAEVEVLDQINKLQARIKKLEKSIAAMQSDAETTNRLTVLWLKAIFRRIGMHAGPLDRVQDRDKERAHRETENEADRLRFDAATKPE